MDLEKMIPLEAVAERDMDLLLLEELHVNEDFLYWLTGRALGSGIRHEAMLNAWHSISDARLGESDLVLLSRDSANRRVALLIENKITALAQPAQAQRYKDRGTAGVAEGDWEAYRTCIVGPAAYLESNPEARDYDVKICYEEIADLLERGTANPRRGKYRAGFIRAAIAQARRGYRPINDPRMEQFWKNYQADVNELFPELQFQPQPGPRPANSTWMVFVPEALPRGRSINHKFENGHVDLATEYLAGRRDEVERLLQPLLDPRDMKVEITGRSLAVRVLVPRLKGLESYESQRELARQGMRAAYRLLYLSPALPVATQGTAPLS